MTVDIVVVGGGMLLLVVVLERLFHLLHSAAPRLPAVPDNPALPELGPYRTPGEEADAMATRAPEATGPYHNCPQCGAPAMRCSGCGGIRTDVAPNTVHVKFDSTQCGTFVENSDAFLGYTHLTSLLRLCSPQQRVSVGWWGWLTGTRCKKHGLHVHQMCDRCGWRGVAYVGRIPALHEP